MLKSFAAMAAICLVSTPALAVINLPFTFDLNGTGTAGGGTSFGNYRTYSMTSSGADKLTVNLKVSAWTLKDGKITAAYLGNNTSANGGLYDINKFEGNGANNTHTIDNQGGVASGVDFLLFQFDRNVQLTGVTANAFSVGGSIDNDLTVGRSVSITNSWDPAKKKFSTDPTGLNNLVVGDMADLFQAQKNIYSSTTGGSLDAARVLNPTGGSVVTGKVWMISASLANTDKKIDGFKLDSLKLQTNSTMGVLGAVPEPATWLTMIVGFGAIGAMARRRHNLVARTA